MLSKKEDVSDMVYLSFKIIAAIGIVIGIAGYVFSYDLMNTRYHVIQAELEQSAASFRYLMICFVAMCTTYIFGTLLTANGSLKQLNYMAAGGVVLNFALNYYYIQTEGAVGAAKASMITQVLTAVIQMILALWLLSLKINYKEILRIVLFIIGVILIAKNPLFQDWTSNILMFLMLSGVWVLISGMLQPKKVLEILKSRE
jgi:O-antigen/teichoic acid export membrane protein